jgi:hypothetical protein
MSRASRLRSRTLVAFVRATTLGALLLLASVARAQQPAPDAEPVGTPGLRIVAGQSAVVGGNSAGARDRALDEAFRLAVDQALAEMLDAPTRAAQARALKGLEARARTYVRRYRALEEGETAGAYAVKLEVEVDEPALRRATERLGVGPPAAPAVAPGLLVVAGAAPEAAPLLLAALASLGVRAQAADSTVTEATAVAAATRATLTEVAFVTAESRAEGSIRGTSKVADACRLVARVVGAPAGRPIAEHSVPARAFADDDEAARAQCYAHAAGELAARLVPEGGAAVGPAGDLRTVTVDADVVEPAAVVALLKDVRSVGSVSSAEVRKIAPGHAEIRARTRSSASALAPALARDATGALALSNVTVAGDVIRMRARLRLQVAPPPSSTPTQGAP